MTETFIPVNTPLLDGNEAEYLAECIRTGWISSEGPFVKRFEEAMADVAGRRHGIAVTNGSVALDIAVYALGLEPGDEVIIPTFTIISCAAAVVRAGLVPVAVDCDTATWNMTIEGVEAAITPRTRAIMPVHIYGLPVDLGPILELARKRGLKVIEDAAEMHGQTYRGSPCGSFGDVSTFSFYPNKHVTTGEGGMILTDDDALADRLSGLRNLCFQPQQRFIHEELGWNARMTNLQAALGVAQVERLPRTIEIKRRIGRLYDEHLADLPSLRPPARPQHQLCRQHLLGVWCRPERRRAVRRQGGDAAPGTERHWNAAFLLVHARTAGPASNGLYAERLPPQRRDHRPPRLLPAERTCAN